MSKTKPSKSVADESTREKLFQEAARMFGQQGYEGVSLRALAQAVGIQAGSIFHHFSGGKRQLYEEIRGRIIAQFAAYVQEWVRSQAEPATAIVELAALVWDYFAAHPESASLYLREAIEQPQDQDSYGQVNEVMNLAEAFMAQAQANGKLRKFDVRAFMFWVGVYCLNFHGAPGFARQIFEPGTAAERETLGRRRFLADVKAYVELR